MPLKSFNIHNAYRSVAILGDNRSGKTIFLSDTLLNDVFPWWSRILYPPRGLFLTGSQRHPTIDDWLRSQTKDMGKANPWTALMDLLIRRQNEQKVRLFLLKVFKSSLPSFLRPQPVIIIVDQAEELMKAFRANFLVAFYDLVKQARDTDLYRLVLVINTEKAVKAIELLNGGNMFDVITAPKVSRGTVVAQYGDDFAMIFDDCDGCIGIAFDYKNGPQNESAREFTAKMRAMFVSRYCLTKEITRVELDKATVS